VISRPYPVLTGGVVVGVPFQHVGEAPGGKFVVPEFEVAPAFRQPFLRQASPFAPPPQIAPRVRRDRKVMRRPELAAHVAVVEREDAGVRAEPRRGVGPHYAEAGRESRGDYELASQRRGGRFRQGEREVQREAVPAYVPPPPRPHAHLRRFAVFAGVYLAPRGREVAERRGQRHRPRLVFQRGLDAQRTEIDAGVGPQRAVAGGGRRQMAFVVDGGAEGEPARRPDAIPADEQVVVVNVFLPQHAARRIVLHLADARRSETAGRGAVFPERGRPGYGFQRGARHRERPVPEGELPVVQLGQRGRVRPQRVAAGVERGAAAQDRGPGVPQRYPPPVNRVRRRQAAQQEQRLPKGYEVHRHFLGRRRVYPFSGLRWR
jgi:hypothetical protein